MTLKNMSKDLEAAFHHAATTESGARIVYGSRADGANYLAFLRAGVVRLQRKHVSADGLAFWSDYLLQEPAGIVWRPSLPAEEWPSKLRRSK